VKKYLVILLTIVVCLVVRRQQREAILSLTTCVCQGQDRQTRMGTGRYARRRCLQTGSYPGAVNCLAGFSKAFADDTKRQTESLAKMEQTLGEMGIGNDSHIIVYGEPKHTSWNAVMFWAMELFGCNSDSMRCTVRFYDEGVNGWKADGGTLDLAAPAVKPATFRP